MSTSSLPPPPQQSNSTPRQSSHSHISSTALQSRLSTLRNRSSKLQQSLTQQLATSPSGQKLLHIGPSLSTIPPDLHTLLTNLNPLLSEVEQYKERCEEELKTIEQNAEDIRRAERRAANARDCALIYQDLIAGETNVSSLRNVNSSDPEEANRGDATGSLSPEGSRGVAALERAALTTLHLVQQLKTSTQQSAAVIRGEVADDGSDTEKAQFLIKLAPRIRRLESDTIKCLVRVLEAKIGDIKEGTCDMMSIGHCLRGLALLGRGKEAESAFARVAIMPLIRSKISLGRLDEGGSRGQCAGLFSLLDDIACSIAETYGPVLCLSEGIFSISTAKSFQRSNVPESLKGVEVDLVTAGVWLPIATALMTDPSIKMAIFSPGIANILQANYTALDIFLSELAERLLKTTSSSDDTTHSNKASDNNDPNDDEAEFSQYYYKPTITQQNIMLAQQRIYSHPSTQDFSKKWNLPIYYQLRFQECSGRLNKAIDAVTKSGWLSPVFTGTANEKQKLEDDHGFELPLFLELYNTLVWMWDREVILRPLTHRFLRGAIQLVQRTVVFIQEGLDGKLLFGSESEEEGDGSSNGRYSWCDSVETVAAVAWELTVLESTLTNDYPKTIYDAVAPEDDRSITPVDTPESRDEIRSLVLDALLETAATITPLITYSWNELVATHLIQSCSHPLSAVKGVAATYRMTNRPPPTNPSPFVATILRPLARFDTTFSSRTPPHVGIAWKERVIGEVSEKYASAVSELLDTIRRTEAALKNRKARRAVAGGMSDGEKVKLQLFLDYKEFNQSVERLGVAVGDDSEEIQGLARLQNLTLEGEALWLERNEK